MIQSMATPRSKRTRELLRQLPPGVRIEKSGRKGHLLVFGPDGEQLRDERGMPILIAGTTNCPPRYELDRIRRALC